MGRPPLPIGRFSDRLGRKRLYLGGVAVTGAFAFPFFLLLDTRSTVLIWAAMIVSAARRGAQNRKARPAR
ncbi:hypothetical protein [Saccharopolyspora shandongensis]|uniref:hypothetical protein n=1 Tax=Saccharopolyspora shandongensis TaxID=418495 RepID=UPI0033D190BA